MQKLRLNLVYPEYPNWPQVAVVISSRRNFAILTSPPLRRLRAPKKAGEGWGERGALQQRMRDLRSAGTTDLNVSAVPPSMRYPPRFSLKQ